MGDAESGSGGPAPVAHVPDPDWLANIVKTLVAAGATGAALAFIHAHVAMTTALALAAAREAAIKDMLDRIAAGTSKVKFDPSTTEEFRNQQIEYLKELAHTEIGFQLLSDLDASGFTVTVGSGTGGNTTTFTNAAFAKADGTAGAGSAATISMNPALTVYNSSDATPPAWATERAKYGLYHELVHAWHAGNGTMASESEHNGAAQNEWQALGVGPYDTLTISDNKIREAMGKGVRPGYGGMTYDGDTY